MENFEISSIRLEICGPKGRTFRVELKLIADPVRSADPRSSLEPPFSAEPAGLERHDFHLRSCLADSLIGRFKHETTKP